MPSRLSLLPVLAAAVVLPGAVRAQEAPAPASPPAPGVDKLLEGLLPRELGPTNMGGRIQDLAVYEKEPRIFYVATASGGLWKTVNAGITFTPVFYREGTVSLGAVAVSQTNPDIVYVGTGEGSSRNSVSWGDGVYKSTDGGKTWTNLGLKETHHISRIAIHPTNPDIVYVGALGRLWGSNPERGLFKTADGGKTWQHVLKVDDRTGVAEVVMDPKDPENLLVATWQRVRKPYDFIAGGPGSGLWRTTNGGKSFTRVTRGLPNDGALGRIGISYFRKDPKVVYASVEFRAKVDEKAPTPPPPAPAPGAPRTPPAPRFNGGGFFRSTDGGASWTKMSDLNPRPFYFSNPKADPIDPNRVYLLAVNYHYSDDLGKTFKVQAQNVHVDHHSIWINPQDSNHIIIGNDGGVAQTRDRGEKWEHLNGMAIGQFYAIAVDMRRPYWVYGGLQDNGSWGFPTQTVNGGPAFWDATGVGGGDGFHVQIDPTDWRTVYSESQGGAITRINQQTGESKFIRPRAPEGERYRFNWSSPIQISPHNPFTIYFGGNKLFKSVNRGDAWSVISPDLTTNNPRKQAPGKFSVTPEDTGAERHCTIVTISESPLKQGLLYVGTDDGLVHVSRNDGASWTELTPNFPDLPANTWCSRVVASKWAEGRVYATFDGHRSNDFRSYVYVSEDYGKTWSKLNAGLPQDDPIYVIREGVQNPDLLFLGSELSLRVSLDRGKTWVRYRTGNWPTVAVHDLVIHPRELDLVVGTHGRSLWTIDVSPLEQMTQEVLSKAPAALFRPQDVLRLGAIDQGSWDGDRVFTSRNTQPGTNVYFYLREDSKTDLTVTITDVTGEQKMELKTAGKAGLNSVRWTGRLGGRLVEAGTYRASLKVGDKEYVVPIRVVDAYLTD